MKRRRLLFLFSHLHKGGMQNAVSNISQALPDDYEQYVGFYGSEGSCFQYKAKLHDFDIPGSLTKGPVGKLINFLRRLSVLRSFVVKNKIDIVVSFGEAANVINLASGHRARKVISLRVALKESLKDLQGYGKVYLNMIRMLYARSDAVVAVSEELAREAISVIPKLRLPIIIPNLYLADKIINFATEPLPNDMNFLNKRRFILNVGSLNYQKGQDDLIQAFFMVRERCPDVCLVIIGCGELKAQLREQVASLGICNDVYFLEFDPNPYRYMARASAFVLTSRYEGFPNVLVEAMFCGCPIVAFDCPTGPREILNNGEFGSLVEERSLSKLASEICTLIDDETRINHAKEMSLKRSIEYTADKVIEKWKTVLNNSDKNGCCC